MRIDSKKDRYLEVRIKQLKEELPKNDGDSLTEAWYNRLIQELQWVVDVEEKEKSNCWMGDDVQ